MNIFLLSSLRNISNASATIDLYMHRDYPYISRAGRMVYAGARDRSPPVRRRLFTEGDGQHEIIVMMYHPRSLSVSYLLPPVDLADVGITWEHYTACPRPLNAHHLHMVRLTISATLGTHLAATLGSRSTARPLRRPCQHHISPAHAPAHQTSARLGSPRVARVSLLPPSLAGSHHVDRSITHQIGHPHCSNGTNVVGHAGPQALYGSPGMQIVSVPMRLL